MAMELLLVMIVWNSPRLMNSDPIMSVKTVEGLNPKPMKATMAPVGGTGVNVFECRICVW